VQRRWANSPDPPHPTKSTASDPGNELLGTLAGARAALARGSEDGDGIAAATGDVLVALAAGERGAPWGMAAQRFDRTTRSPRAGPFPGPAAVALRRLARRLLTTPGRAGRAATGGVALAVALAGLMTEIAAWQQAHGRPHQAAAARAAADAATRLVLAHPAATGLRPGRVAPGRGNRRPPNAAPTRAGSGRSGRSQNSEPLMTPSASSPPAPAAAPRAGGR
jgi:hypothetical protein